MNVALSVDWLQLHVDCSFVNYKSDYEWIKHDYQTKQFRNVYTVKYKNEEFASVVCNPTSPIISPKCMLVKLSNRELYGQSIVGHVNDFLEQSKLVYVSMTRIDIAADFNNFFGTLDPHVLISRFIKSKYLKIGAGKYQLNGSQEFEHTFDYLRFGSKTSDINVYLYNKTKEFKEVKDKPYVREKWRKCGVNEKKTVWRLEVSLKGSGSNYCDTNTGQILKLDYKDIEKGNFLHFYYMAYINKYFKFVVNNGLSRKDRMENVKLFTENYTPFINCYLPNETGAEKSDKVFLKKLYLLDQELRGFNHESLDSRQDVLETFINATGLQNYYDKKKEGWKKVAFRQ